MMVLERKFICDLVSSISLCALALAESYGALPNGPSFKRATL